MFCWNRNGKRMRIDYDFASADCVCVWIILFSEKCVWNLQIRNAIICKWKIMNHAVEMKIIIINLRLRLCLRNSVWWRTGLKQNNYVQNTKLLIYPQL